MTDSAELDLDELAASGFTAGPWIADFDTGQPISDFLPERVCLEHPNFDAIAISFGLGVGWAETIDEHLANAALLAAAPSLLEIVMKQRVELKGKDERIAELEKKLDGAYDMLAEDRDF